MKTEMLDTIKAGEILIWNGAELVLKADYDAAGPEEVYATKGMLLKADDEQRLVVSVAMVPELVDTHGDIADAEVIENAAHSFLATGGTANVQHTTDRFDGLHIVESYIVRKNTSINGIRVKAGTWVVAMKVESDFLWQLVKDGAFKGFSIEGFAEVEELV